MNGSTSPSGYDEATIVRLMTELYWMNIKLGVWEESDIAWPPPEGHALDLSGLPDDYTLDPRVISLMKHLPIPDTTWDREMAGPMHPVDYRGAQSLLHSRYIQPLDGYPAAPPTVLMLLVGFQQADAPSVILDVSDNTIRVFDGVRDMIYDDYTENEPDDDKVGAYSNELMNWPTEPAPQYLERMVRRYLDGRFIPALGIYMITEVDSHSSYYTKELRRILMEDYGWPTNFKQAEWKQNGGEIAERLSDEEDQHEKQAMADRRKADRKMAESLLRDQGVVISHINFDPENPQEVKSILEQRYRITEDGRIVYWD